MKILRLSEALKLKYGEKIYRLSLTSGCGCPNRDGRVGKGGCNFCSRGGSGEFGAALSPIDVQIEEAKAVISRKSTARSFIAYFQSYTNTYGEAGRLWELYSAAAKREDIRIVSIATRPDCLPEDIMDMLIALNRKKPVWVELGLQTVHDATAAALNRGYDLPVFEDAYRRLKEAGLEVIVHVILGLPGETQEDMLQTARFLAQLKPVLDGVKIQMLQILKDTALGDEYLENPFHLLTMDEYGELLVSFLKILKPETVIHRMTGDGPKKLLIAPLWCADKKRVLNYLNRIIEKA